MLYYSMIKKTLIKAGKTTTINTTKKFKEVKTSKKPKLEKGQDIPIEAIDKYFLADTADIFVPDKVVNVDAKGKIKLIDTLNKNKTFRKIKGKPVINIEDRKIGFIGVNEGEKLKNRSESLILGTLKKLSTDIETLKDTRYDITQKIKNIDSEKLPRGKQKEIQQEKRKKKIEKLQKKDDLLFDKIINKYKSVENIRDKFNTSIDPRINRENMNNLFKKYNINYQT
jgi:hypothetical protein